MGEKLLTKLRAVFDRWPNHGKALTPFWFDLKCATLNGQSEEIQFSRLFDVKKIHF